MGVFDGTLGVAWPSMRQDLHQPLAALGLILLVSTVPFLLVSVALDQVIDWLGVRGGLVAGFGLFVVALLLIALGSWPVVLAGAVAWGFATGFVNAAINVYTTVLLSGSSMQLLHGLWGVGTLAGPLLVTGSLLTGHGWRPPLLLDAAGQLGLLFWVLAGSKWPDPRQRRHPTERIAISPALVLGTLAFFLYTAAEWTGGQWSFTVLTQSRGFSLAAGGLAVSLYWTGLTAGRLLGGVAGLRLRTEVLLGIGLALAMVGAAGFWLLPAASALMLPLLGFGLAPVYPALMKLTARRVPGGTVGLAVGLQTASGGVGSALTPAAAGLALQRFGLPILGPVIFGLTVVTAGVSLLLELPASGRTSPASERTPPPLR